MTDGPQSGSKCLRESLGWSSASPDWAPLRESGKKVLFVCDGNYTQFVDEIAACGNHGFWFEIFTDLGVMVEKFGKTHFLIGNADTRILLSGKREKIRAEMERCLSAGKNCPGYFMAVTNHIPPNTPVESALYYNQVYEELCWRRLPMAPTACSRNPGTD